MMIVVMVIMETMIVMMIKPTMIARHNTAGYVSQKNAEAKQANNDSHSVFSTGNPKPMEKGGERLKSHNPFRDHHFFGSVNPCSSNHWIALGPSVQIRKTSCAVPVPIYRHFKPAGVWYWNLKLFEPFPRLTLIRPGTIRET
jgi:hypothetical protein